MNGKIKYLKIFCNLITMAVVLLLLIFVFPKIVMFFIPFVVAFFLSLIANPIVKFLEKHIKINRRFGSVLLIVSVMGLVIFLCYGVVIALASGLRSFTVQLPDMLMGIEAEFTGALNGLQNMLNDMPFISDVDFSQIVKAVSDYMGSLSAEGIGSLAVIGDTAKKIPNMIVNFIIGLLATYFFIAEREKLLVILKEHLPEQFRNQIQDIYRQTILVVAGYFKAQFKIMGVIYVVLVIGLMILKVRYSWLVGFGIALLDMLPVFGTGTVLEPWALIKLLSGNYRDAAGLMILYGVTFGVHHAIQPKLVGDSVGMDPFLALLFMYIGYRVSSFAGMILAIPVGMIFINLVKTGVFDQLILCVKILVQDFNRFRKM